MRKTLIAVLAFLLIGAAPLALAAVPEESPTAMTWALSFLEALGAWLGFSTAEAPEEPVAVAPERDGEASSVPETGGEIGPGLDPEGGEAGPGWDPQGWQQTGAPDEGGEAGPGLDPQG